jgi:hypothetical protein
MTIIAKRCPIEIAVTPWSNSNRPGLAMTDPSFVTVHEVGNTSPGADEDMHRDFVHNGGGQFNVSFHAVVGPTKAIVLLPMNEAAWHASDGFSGRGNRDTFAIETIQIGDFNKTLSHLAWFIAELFRNPGQFPKNPAFAMIDDLDPTLAAERIKQHNFWAPDKKNCPQFIRDRGLWQPLLNAVKAELGARSRYVSPILPEWWTEQALLDLVPHDEGGIHYTPLGTRVTLVKEKTVCYASGLDLKAGKTRPDIKRGDTADVRYVYRNALRQEFGITRYGTHVRMSGFTPKITVSVRTPG